MAGLIVMTHVLRIPILLLATALLSSGPLYAQAPAAMDQTTELSKIQDVEFRLVRFLSDGKEIPIPPAVTITLAFRKDSQISGHSAVNNYAGRFTAEPDGDIAIQLTTSTQMAGPPEAMELEREYFDVLSHVKHFHLKPDQVILENETTSMKFAPSRSK